MRALVLVRIFSLAGCIDHDQIGDGTSPQRRPRPSPTAPRPDADLRGELPRRGRTQSAKFP
jgi:hypothetical protein